MKVLSDLHEHCHSGDRSDFVNEAVQENSYSRREKAFELMEEFRKHKIRMTTAQIIKARIMAENKIRLLLTHQCFLNLW